MSDDPSVPRGPPPEYGSVETQQPMAQPPAFPQPGVAAPLSHPTEPPPKYEPNNEMYQAHPGYQSGHVIEPTNQPQHGHTTIIIQERGFGPNSRYMECLYCHASITTRVEPSAGGLVWLTSGLICLFGCWAGCCLIPFCIADLHDVRHTCPNCERFLGVHHRL